MSSTGDRDSGSCGRCGGGKGWTNSNSVMVWGQGTRVAHRTCGTKGCLPTMSNVSVTVKSTGRKSACVYARVESAGVIHTEESARVRCSYTRP